jgi:spore maturation protein CgeB
LKILILTENKPYDYSLESFYLNAFSKIKDIEAEIIYLNDKQGFYTRLTQKILREYYRISDKSRPANFNSDKLLEVIKRKNPDVIITAKLDILSESFLSQLKSVSKILLNINPDHPYVIHKNNIDVLLNTLKYYDAVFTFGKGIIPVYYQLGAKQVYWLPFAYDPEIHFVSKTSDYIYDCSYFGSWAKIQEHYISSLMDENYKVGIFGPRWYKSKNKNVKKSWIKDAGIGKGISAEVSKSRIVFNLIRAEHGCFHSMKTFELPACGAFIISNRSNEQLEFFPETAVCYFDTLDELKEKVKFYRNKDDIRNKFIKESLDFVKNHTYDARATNLVNFINTGKYKPI